VCVVDKRAVPRASIAQSHHAVRSHLEYSVIRGDGAALDDEIVAGCATDRPVPTEDRNDTVSVGRLQNIYCVPLQAGARSSGPLRAVDRE
jgi:hypothetical protein